MKTEDLTAYAKQKESVEKEITSCLLSINNKMEECYSGRIQRANALHRKVIKSFRKNTQKEYKNLIFLLVED